MKLSAGSFRVFLVVSLASHHASSFTLPGSAKRSQQSTVLLHEKKEDGNDNKKDSFFSSFFPEFKNDASTRKSLGIEDDYSEEDDVNAKPYWSENSGKPIPNWTPPAEPEPTPPKEAPPAEALAAVAVEEEEKVKETPPAKEVEEVTKRPTMSLTSEQQDEMSTKAKEVVDQIMNPLLGSEIVKGVSYSTIQTVSISTALLALSTTKSINAAALTLVGMALITITPGPIGNACRLFGNLAYTSVSGLWKFSERIGVQDAVGEQFARIEYGAKMEKIRRVESEVQNSLMEAEAALKGVDSQMEEIEQFQSSVKDVLDEADSAISDAMLLQGEGMEYDAYLKSAYEASGKTDDYETFKTAFETAAVAGAGVKNKADISIPYDAAAKNAYEASGKKGDYKTFKDKFEASAVADVIAKNKPDISVPYDAAAINAYEASGKTEIFATFKKKFEATAVANVVKKKAAKEAEEAKVAKEAQMAEKARLAEEERLVEEARVEEKRVVEEARLAEEERLAEEARLKEVARVAEEDRLAEEARLEELARVAEEERLAEEARVEELARGAEEKRVEEEALLAESKRLAEEEEAARLLATDPDEEEGGFSDMDWEASIEMAKDNVDGKIVGVDDVVVDDNEKADWDAARQFAESLTGGQKEPPMVFDDEVPSAIGGDEVDMEALAKAARAAVEQYEQEMAGAVEPVEDDESSESFTSMFDDEANMEDIAAAARKAADMYNSDVYQEDEALFDDGVQDAGVMESVRATPVQNWFKSKVVDLKKELASRGLGATGKKAELVARLEENDAELSLAPEISGSDEIDFSEMSMEEIAKAAREAAELFDGEEPSDEVLMMLENEELDMLEPEPEEAPKAAPSNYSSMNVAALKDALRSRGLKLGGKKQDLIDRLQEGK